MAKTGSEEFELTAAPPPSAAQPEQPSFWAPEATAADRGEPRRQRKSVGEVLRRSPWPWAGAATLLIAASAVAAPSVPLSLNGPPEAWSIPVDPGDFDGLWVDGAQVFVQDADGLSSYNTDNGSRNWNVGLADPRCTHTGETFVCVTSPGPTAEVNVIEPKEEGMRWRTVPAPGAIFAFGVPDPDHIDQGADGEEDIVVLTGDAPVDTRPGGSIARYPNNRLRAPVWVRDASDDDVSHLWSGTFTEVDLTPDTATLWTARPWSEEGTPPAAINLTLGIQQTAHLFKFGSTSTSSVETDPRDGEDIPIKTEVYELALPDYPDAVLTQEAILTEPDGQPLYPFPTGAPLAVLEDSVILIRADLAPPTDPDQPVDPNTIPLLISRVDIAGGDSLWEVPAENLTLCPCAATEQHVITAVVKIGEEGLVPVEFTAYSRADGAQEWSLPAPEDLSRIAGGTDRFFILTDTSLTAYVG